MALACGDGPTLQRGLADRKVCPPGMCFGSVHGRQLQKVRELQQRGWIWFTELFLTLKFVILSGNLYRRVVHIDDV